MPLVDVDNNLLIQEVKARPCLYKKEHPRYIDSAFKKSLWEDVAEIVFHGNWANYTKEEKVTQVRALFMRWKNLRACFTRELRTQMKLKQRYGTTKQHNRHEYRYFNDLQFLRPHVEVHNYTFDVFGDEPVEQDNSSNEVKQQTPATVPQIKTYTRIQRQVQQFPNSEHVLSKNVKTKELAAVNASSNKDAEQFSLKPQVEAYDETNAIVQQSKKIKKNDVSVKVTIDPPIEIDNSSDEDAAQPIIKLYTKPKRKFQQRDNYKKRKVSENLQVSDVHGDSIFVNFHELPKSSTVKTESTSPSRVIATDPLDIINSSSQKEPAEVIIKYESPSPVEFEATESTIRSETSIVARDHSYVTNLNNDQSVETANRVDSVGPGGNCTAVPSEIDWKTFALSLVPMLKMLPVHKSLDAQIEILTTVKRCLYSDSTVSSNRASNTAIQDGGPSRQRYW